MLGLNIFCFMRKPTSLFVAVFMLQGVFGPEFLSIKQAEAAEMMLPSPQQMLPLSDNYSLPVLRGIKINPNNPLELEFVVDREDKKDVSQEETAELIRYFLAGLAVPSEQIWVNLSPYESERVIEPALEQTELGEQMLAQDYVLKQLSSSLLSPESEIGSDYWNATAGLKDEAFNKIWIMPRKAEVLEHINVAYVKDAQLKVMLDSDYLAMLKNEVKDSSEAEDILREKLLPAVEKEVNEGKNFARLRQVYHSLVLSAWFKQKFKDSFYKYYFNQSNVKGIDLADDESKDKVFKAYVESFNKGVFNTVKKVNDPITGRKVKRQYFSGGAVDFASSSLVEKKANGIKAIEDASDNRDQFTTKISLKKDIKSTLEDVANSSINVESLASDVKEMFLTGKEYAPERKRSMAVKVRINDGEYKSLFFADKAVMDEKKQLSEITNESLRDLISTLATTPNAKITTNREYNEIDPKLKKTLKQAASKLKAANATLSSSLVDKVVNFEANSAYYKVQNSRPLDAFRNKGAAVTMQIGEEVGILQLSSLNSTNVYPIFTILTKFSESGGEIELEVNAPNFDSKDKEIIKSEVKSILDTATESITASSSVEDQKIEEATETLNMALLYMASRYGIAGVHFSVILSDNSEHILQFPDLDNAELNASKIEAMMKAIAEGAKLKSFVTGTVPTEAAPDLEKYFNISQEMVSSSIVEKEFPEIERFTVAEHAKVNFHINNAIQVISTDELFEELRKENGILNVPLNNNKEFKIQFSSNPEVNKVNAVELRRMIAEIANSTRVYGKHVTSYNHGHKLHDRITSLAFQAVNDIYDMRNLEALVDSIDQSAVAEQAKLIVEELSTNLLYKRTIANNGELAVMLKNGSTIFLKFNKLASDETFASLVELINQVAKSNKITAIYDVQAGISAEAIVDAVKKQINEAATKVTSSSIVDFDADDDAETVEKAVEDNVGEIVKHFSTFKLKSALASAYRHGYKEFSHMLETIGGPTVNVDLNLSEAGLKSFTLTYVDYRGNRQVKAINVAASAMVNQVTPGGVKFSDIPVEVSSSSIPLELKGITPEFFNKIGFSFLEFGKTVSMREFVSPVQTLKQ